MERPFIIQADASNIAVGAVLLQHNKEGILQPCAYKSRKFMCTEQNWAIWEKEAFAVKWVLQTWRHLLEGGKHPFEVWTDHENLVALQTPWKLSPKQVRWAHYFQRFRFVLKYISAGCNVLADALSRLPQYNGTQHRTTQAMVIPKRHGSVALDKTITHDWMRELEADLQMDAWLKENPSDVTYRKGLAW